MTRIDAIPIAPPTIGEALSDATAYQTWVFSLPVVVPAMVPALRVRRARGARRGLAVLAAVAFSVGLVLAGCASAARQAPARSGTPWIGQQAVSVVQAARQLLVPAATDACREPAPAYVLSGHPGLGHGAETVSVQLGGSVHHVHVYAEPASGDYQAFVLAHWDTHTHRWVGVFTFTSADESGTWYVVSTIGETAHGLEQRTGPMPAFTVAGAA